MSLNNLIAAVAKTQNPTVVGLDPALDLVPEFIKRNTYEKYGETLKGAAKAVLKFNKGIIDAVCDIVPAVKPQLAFYEALGAEGIKAFRKTAEYAKKRGLYVIADAKRGDIGSTAKAYADAYLGKIRVGGNTYEPFPADALTVNPYIGSDCVEPFADACKANGKGIFILVKTSNPSSGELQDKLIDGVPVYEIIGKMCERWGFGDTRYGYSGLGAVVGATYPEQLKELRRKMPNTFFLVPGYGAQGAGAADVAGAFGSNGLGGIVNSSRGIIAAYLAEKCDERDYAGAAYRAAVLMRDEIMKFVGEIVLP